MPSPNRVRLLTRIYERLFSNHSKWNARGLARELLQLGVTPSTSRRHSLGLLDDLERLLADVRRGLGGAPPHEFKSFQEYERWAVVNRACRASEWDHRVLRSYFETARLFYQAQDFSRPLVSFVMPVKDREHLVWEAIRSITEQDYENLEVLVVDDGSSDGTPLLLNKLTDPRIRVFQNSHTPGVSGARNTALTHARGEWIFYLDSDNQLRSETLRSLVGAITSRPSIRNFYFAQEVLTGQRGAEVAKEVRYGPFHRALLENHNFIDLNAFVHHRTVFEELGGFNENLSRLVDYDLILRYTAQDGAQEIPILASCYYEDRAPDRISVTVPLVSARVQIDQEHKGEPMALQGAENDSLFRALPRLDRTGRSRPVTVVIPSYEALDCLKLALESVRTFSPDDTRIVVVDNGSSASIVEYLEGKPYDTECILNGKNYGFTRAANQGLAERHGTDVVLFNNDAVATPYWLDGLWDAIDRHPDTAIVVPRQVLLPNRDSTLTHVPSADLRFECDVNISQHHDNFIATLPGGLMELSFAPFFCAYLRGHTLTHLSQLDQRLGRHYRSDRFYCDAVRGFGLGRLIYTPYSKVYHFLQESTNQLRRARPHQFNEMFVENDWA